MHFSIAHPIETTVRCVAEADSGRKWFRQTDRFYHFAYDDDDQRRTKQLHRKYCESIESLKLLQTNVNSNILLSQIRRKLRAGTLNVRLLEETVQLFPTILLDYSKILFELLDAFARDKNAAISSFAGAAYRIVFGIENCDRKLLLSKLIGFVYERHAQATSLSEGCCSNASATAATTDITTNALMILTEINEKYPIEMQNNGLQILVS